MHLLETWTRAAAQLAGVLRALFRLLTSREKKAFHDLSLKVFTENTPKAAEAASTTLLKNQIISKSLPEEGKDVYGHTADPVPNSSIFCYLTAFLGPPLAPAQHFSWDFLDALYGSLLIQPSGASTAFPSVTSPGLKPD